MGKLPPNKKNVRIPSYQKEVGKTRATLKLTGTITRLAVKRRPGLVVFFKLAKLPTREKSLSKTPSQI